MIDYGDALRLMLERIQPLPARSVPLQQAHGAVLAETVRANWDLPRVDNSAMDGYALDSAAVDPGRPLQVLGFAPAGQPFIGHVGAQEAVRIMTGAPLPAGCDAVVPVEQTETAGETVRLLLRPQAGQHVRRRGEEIRRNETVLEPGTQLQSGELAMLASLGAVSVAIHRRPRVALLCTGDELVELGTEPQFGQLVNSNRWLLAARLQEEGAEVKILGPAPDRRGELRCLLAAAADCDLLVTTGGVSVGDHDLVQEVLHDSGFERLFWQVAIKPGKPVLFGLLGTLPVLGLPGNPAAAAATFELFARPAVRRLAGSRELLPPLLRVVLTASIRGGEKRQRFIWGVLRREGGRYLFTPSSSQGSGQNRGLQGAQALLPVAAGSDELVVGDEVEVWLLRLPPGQPWQ